MKPQHVFPTDEVARAFLPDGYEQHTLVRGQGTINPDIVLVLKEPNNFDLKTSRPLSGPSGTSIRRTMLHMGLSFYVTYAYPLFLDGQKSSIVRAREVNPLLQEELRRVGGDKMYTFGADATRWGDTGLTFKRYDEVSQQLHRLPERLLWAGHALASINYDASSFAEFVTGLERLMGQEGLQTPPPPEDEEYRYIRNRLQADRVLSSLPDLLACDTEATGLDPFTAKLLTIQLSGTEGIGYSFPWGLFTPEEWQWRLLGKNLIFQNSSYDVKILHANGVYVEAHEDTMLMHSLLDETPMSHSMDQIAPRYLGVEKWTDTVDYDDMEHMDREVMGRYGARDADITLRLANIFRPQVEQRPINRYLHRASRAVIRSEIRGVKVDRDLALQFDQEITCALHDREERLADTYGLQNVSSPQQVAALLYDQMGMPVQKKRDGNNWRVTTEEKFISPFAGDYPVVSDILECRRLIKAQGTYLRKIIDETSRDGRYHADFYLAGTETGRMSDKLLLLVPRTGGGDGDLGQQYQSRLRELFIPDTGHVMIGADYNGLEVSMSAFLTGCQQLMADVNAGRDTHSFVAILAFALNEPLEPYNTLKERVSLKYGPQRQMSKGGTFSWLYGGSVRAIMQATGCDRETAEAIMSALITRYDGVVRWQEATKLHAEETGSVSTPWGRRRRFLFHPGMNEEQREEQRRESVNMPNQGMSTDMNAEAFARLEEQGYQTLFPVHDAIHLQEREDDAERTMAVVKETMEGVLSSRVRFTAEVKMGRNWAEV